ncbi:MAG: UDP-N-acetylmuramoyl-L-alanyl-D-glutamate--2,6-diaminopimelate ligase [Acidimicrobiales bacterium]|nr:UDP-N-acetylmuramoyl-L-alanyl-D-glutamate--2,6-diaminopimelate ligase [Acidimicrobiales bacterium]
MEAKNYSMTLRQILAEIPFLAAENEISDVKLDQAIEGISYDSRDVLGKMLYVCLSGRNFDGHDYSLTAAQKGAVAIVSERALNLGLDIPVLISNEESRKTLAKISSLFYGHPSRDLITIGVTGTNGKTSVTNLARSILSVNGWGVSVVGTLGGARTTPEAPILHRLMANARDRGDRAVAMEVSSHALAQHRVDDISFDVVAFTNLSQDHLDFHIDMEQYFAAKATLFEPGRATTAVVHIGDRWGQRLADMIKEDRSVFLVTVSRDEAESIKSVGGGAHFLWRGHEVTLQWGGAVGVDNALMAAAIADSLGIGEDNIVEGLQVARPVPGRFELVTGSDKSKPLVVVDFAHTPAALSASLRSARACAEGEVIVVFGCGGERDRSKRPMMGSVASELADVVIVTSDNPRSEDPESIADEITEGIDHEETFLAVELDRELAIKRAIEMARPGDVVVVAGKGHETTQTFRDSTKHFDDREIARKYIFTSKSNVVDRKRVEP